MKSKIKKKSSLVINTWIFLIAFSIIILIFLWGFQVLFMKPYYENTKISEAFNTANLIKKYYNEKDGNFEEHIYKLSYNRSICIEISNGKTALYTTDNLNRGCINKKFNPDLVKYKTKFIASGKETTKIKLINQPLENQALIYGVKLDENLYAFLNTSLDPIELTIVILKKQLIIVSGVVLLLSFILGYFISKRLARPIMDLNELAKNLAKGNFDINLKNRSNIKEISELSQSLNYAKEELAKTEELRRDLIANVSHDLKTPLTMIRAYAELVKDISYKDESSRNEHLGIIIDEVDRLNLLVEDILSLSTIQSKIQQDNVEKVNISEMIRIVIKRYEIFSITEAYQFVFNTEDKDLFVMADKKKLEQVIYNLISNAINYTGKDNLVTVNAVEQENNVRVEIIDTGKGIKEEDINHIWDKYYKNEKKHKRNFVGTGLGLSIVKNILVQRNANYGVISSKNKGSNFWFEIEKAKE